MSKAPESGEPGASNGAFDIAGMQRMLIALLRDALPSSVSDETVQQSFVQAQQQELKIGPIYEQLLTPAARLAAPYWGVEIVDSKGRATQVIVPKALDAITDPADLLAWLSVFGLVVAPTARALLMGMGYKFQFKFAKAIKSKLLV